jgi:hypothetical protein
MANDEKSIIPLNVVGVHQVFTNVTVLFQTNDDGQAVFTGYQTKRKLKKGNLPYDAMGSIEDGVLVENGATA